MLDDLLNDGQETAAPRLLFSLKEAAEMLGVSYWCLVDWQRQGRIRTVKCGRLRRVPVAEVERVAREGLR